MSERIVLTPDASDDAFALWQHIARQQDEAAADRFLNQLYDACESIADMPGIGHYRENLLDRRHRFWAVGQYLIVYRWQTRPLEVISIVHGARDLSAFFRDRT